MRPAGTILSLRKKGGAQGVLGISPNDKSLDVMAELHSSPLSPFSGSSEGIVTSDIRDYRMSRVEMR